MIKYLVKRILIFLPTLFVLSLIVFGLSKVTPGDPVQQILDGGKGGKSDGQSAKANSEKAYRQIWRDLGFDQPTFYFSLTNATQSDTLYRIPNKDHRAMLERLSYNYGDWNYVSDYYHHLLALEHELYGVEKTNENAKDLQKAKNLVITLLKTYETDRIESMIGDLEFIAENDQGINNEIGSYVTTTRNSFNEVQANAAPGNQYKPVLNWYGSQNQYHIWMFGDEPWFGEKDPTVYYHGRGFLRGDFGISYEDRRPVASVLWDALSLTFGMSIVSILITYLLSIPIGIFTARHKGKKRERIVSTSLFMLYSMPNFWIGTMMVTFVCGSKYLGWFPPAYSFLEHEADAGFFERLGETVYYLIVPMFVWTYGSLAYISRQMRGGMLTSLGQDYIRTARAKGVSENRVIWKHAFRNSLIPIITIFSSVFPLAISGAIVVELIFSIDGMGKLSLEAINGKNYPIVFTTVMFTGILTLVGTLVSDLLYAVVDPRISYTNKK